ncbi:unnamed protein product [Orchesella dallaii]|uniref:Endocuticle structural glycoprotein SgAbd-2 n=1 Tax=Orchesella dallaii TaxID=48710 RepID=A0ABP1QKZ4_9HEXA
MSPLPGKDDANQPDKSPKLTHLYISESLKIPLKSLEDRKKKVVNALNELSELDHQLTAMNKEGAGKPAARKASVPTQGPPVTNKKTVANVSDPPKKKLSVGKVATPHPPPPKPQEQSSKEKPKVQAQPSTDKLKTTQAAATHDTNAKDPKVKASHHQLASHPNQKKDEKTAPPASSQETKSVDSSVKRRTLANTDDGTLSKKQYGDEQLLAVPSASEKESVQNWVEKKIERVLILDMILTIIAAVLTALACYTLFRLPITIYSHHILKEIFLGSTDANVEAMGFKSPLGLRNVAPLPVANCCMYIFCLWVVYMMQYPKKGKPTQICLHKVNEWNHLKTKITLVSSALFGVVLSKPQQGGQGGRSPYYNPADKQASILRYDNVNNGDGTYQYAYETSNGIAAEEQGFLKNPGTNNEIQTARGSYQYYGPEGQLYRIVYTADENGFQAQGDHLPTPPPIPPEIQKSLDIIYANARQQQAQAGRPGQQRPQGYYSPPTN